MIKFCLIHQIPFLHSCVICEDIRREENKTTKYDETRELQPIEREEL